ncbi:MAG: ankyrin repeat domain-containing protein [Rhodothalassiaceae bacterium]
MRVFSAILTVFGLVALTTAPASAQFSTSYAFIEAVRESNLLEARQLLNRGLTANVRDAEGVPVLVIAAETGDLDMLRFLIESGANINAASRSDGSTALMRLVERRDLAGATYLLEQGPDLDARDKRGETALIKAVKLGRTRLLERLLDAGADPQVADYLGLTALDHARNARSRRALRLLEDAS